MMADNHIPNNIRVTTGSMNAEQAKVVVTFRQQHPEYADGDLVITIAEDNRSVTISPKCDPVFSVKYYMVELLEEVEEEEA